MMNLVATSASAEAGDSVIIPPLYEIFWSAVVFLILWLIFGWAMPKIYKVIDARNEEIVQGLRAGEKAQEDAALAARERREVLKEANEQAREIREKATQDAQRIVSQAREEAQEEASRIGDNAQRQIFAEKQAATVSLREDVGQLAVELAQKIIGEQLKDQALTERVVDRFLDQLEADMDNVGAAAK